MKKTMYELMYSMSHLYFYLTMLFGVLFVICYSYVQYVDYTKKVGKGNIMKSGYHPSEFSLQSETFVEWYVNCSHPDCEKVTIAVFGSKNNQYTSRGVLLIREIPTWYCNEHKYRPGGQSDD